jgi:hypothetical protein
LNTDATKLEQIGVPSNDATPPPPKKKKLPGLAVSPHQSEVEHKTHIDQHQSSSRVYPSEKVWACQPVSI